MAGRNGTQWVTRAQEKGMGWVVNKGAAAGEVEHGGKQEKGCDMVGDEAQEEEGDGWVE